MAAPLLDPNYVVVEISEVLVLQVSSELADGQLLELGESEDSVDVVSQIGHFVAGKRKHRVLCR